MMSVMTGSASPRRRTIPHGRAARRLDWALLPPALRAMIARRLGSPVVKAESAGAGYTPGFASVLTCGDGSRHFVKAASKKAQRTFADAYREEARKLRALPPPRGRGSRTSSVAASTRSRCWRGS